MISNRIKNIKEKIAENNAIKRSNEIYISNVVNNLTSMSIQSDEVKAFIHQGMPELLNEEFLSDLKNCSYDEIVQFRDKLKLFIESSLDTIERGM